MSKINTGGPAFPVIGGHSECSGPYPQGAAESGASMGMSLREYYAGQAMNAWINALSARWQEPGYDDKYACDEAARLSVIAADDLIAELGKEAQS